MNRSPTQHTLREMRSFFAKPATRILLGAAVVLLGVSGPFGTHDALSFGPRFAYWALTAPLTFALGVFVSIYMSQRLAALKARWLAKTLAAFMTAIAVTLAVIVINWLAFEAAPFRRQELIELIISVAAVTAVISLLLMALPELSDTQEPEPPALPPILVRIPLDKRGPLISLSVQDHYVEVTTTKGAELVLMRLSDAIREVGATDGLQVHRSHWVATAQIASAARKGDKALLTMTDGRAIPASRSNIKALKEAGILPR